MANEHGGLTGRIPRLMFHGSKVNEADMRASGLRRVVRSGRSITAALVVTVMIFVVASVVVVLLNDRAGGRAVEASQIADAYDAL